MQTNTRMVFQFFETVVDAD